jgi:formamidopyrimidine-DNA glycosylase
MTGHLLYGKFQITNSKNQTNSKAHLPDGKAGIPKTKENTEKKESWVAVGRGPLRDDPENRFIHLIFNLSNKKSLALCDMRKFAKVMAGPTDKILKSGGINKLGVDPFDKKFTFEYFKNAIGVKRKNIKTALMEQNLVAGIGNIYSDEILWLAGIHPLRTANTLSEKELKKIYESIKPVFKRALKARGSSYVDYRDAFGRKGKYQEMHYAYQRNGEKCQKKDGGILKKIKVGSRSAHFCPKHQK